MRNIEILVYKLFKNFLYNSIKYSENQIIKDSLEDLENYMDNEIAKLLFELKLIIPKIEKYSKESFLKSVYKILPIKLKRKYNLEAIRIILKYEDVSNDLENYIYSNKIYAEKVKNELLTKTLPLSITAIEGRSMQEIKQKLIEMYNWADKKAALHARTSVANILGIIERKNYIKNNLTHYIWNTSNDERVRPSHRQLNGTKRRVGDFPMPKDEFNCRCSMVPILEEVLENLNLN